MILHQILTGKDVNPQIWEDYNGGDLVLNKETGFTLSSEKIPKSEKNMLEKL